MTFQRASLPEWREQFSRKERGCPWPGPRPLTDEDADLLIGRTYDKKLFLAEVSGHRTIVLAGPSGVGKSSLLKAGLIPDLNSAGYRTLLCDTYTGEIDESPEGAPRYLAKLLTNPSSTGYDQNAAKHLEGMPTDETLFPALSKAFGERMVIVLDQFEELIRYAPSQSWRVIELLEALNHQLHTKVVISLRSEFLSRIIPLEKKFKPFTYSRYLLDEIDDTFAREVVEAPSTIGCQSTPDRVHVTFEGSSAENIAREWTNARRQTQSNNTIVPFDRVGLLHLQAFLYSMHNLWLGDRSTTEANEIRVTEELVSKAITAFRKTYNRQADDTPSVHAGPDAAAPLKGAFLDSVDVKLKRCKLAAEKLGIDPYLIEGAVQYVAQSVPHLSSAGYKLNREVLDLSDLSMRSVLNTLVPGTIRTMPTAANVPNDAEWVQFPEQRRPISENSIHGMLSEMVLLGQRDGGSQDPEDDMIDLLTSSRRSLAAHLDSLTGDDDIQSRLCEGASPWVADPLGVTCGPMWGLSATQVLIEEARRFAFALAWLKQSSLIRTSTPAPGVTIVSLIHDGFGQALQLYSANREMESTGPLHALVAIPGSSYEWTDKVRSEGSYARVIANLRWPGVWVRSRFTNVVFVNCDFRGVVFDGCTFEGVSFVNCILDGTILSESSIGAALDAPTAPTNDAHTFDIESETYLNPVPPEFRVAADASYLQIIADYRDMDRLDYTCLHCPLPGDAAIPVTAADAEGIDIIHGNQDGLSIYGGRVAMLTIRQCNFLRGTIDVIRASGSGLDFVESVGVKVRILGSALRHVTLSPHIASSESQTISVTAKGSLLEQVWVSRGLTGVFEIDNCTVIQAWNESSEVAASVDNSTVVGIIGFATSADCTLLPSTVGSVAELDPNGTLNLLARALQMDYRRNAARDSPTVDDGSGEPL